MISKQKNITSSEDGGVQTLNTFWASSYCNFGIHNNMCKGAQYEVYVNWCGDQWTEDNIKGGLTRFGWGTRYIGYDQVGKNDQSFGYGGTCMFSHNNEFIQYGESYGKGDTITCAISFINN